MDRVLGLAILLAARHPFAFGHPHNLPSFAIGFPDARRYVSAKRAASMRTQGAGMDILAWIGWLLLSVLGLVWTVVWFLISGWVSTLLQIAILVIVIYSFKYGWQRAPHEIWRRTRGFARFFWNWLRAREPNADRPAVETREVVKVVRGREFGDVNASSLLTALMLTGLFILGLLP
jgi:hypothetical protein